MVAADAPHGNSAAAAADDLFIGGPDLHAFFDHAALVEGKAGGGRAVREEEEEELEWLSNKDAFPAVETMAPAEAARPRTNGPRRRPSRAAAAAGSGAAGRRCGHCGAERTPQWRDGPEGRRTLCNACGVRYRSGRLVPEYRPLNSPTFRPELHSNRHSRVVEMRRCQGKPAAAKASDGEEEMGGGEELERPSNKCAVPPGETMMMACSPARPRTKGLRRPRGAVSWSPPPPPRAPTARVECATKIQLWRSTAAQTLAASAAAPVAGGAPGGESEMGLGVSTGGLIRRPPMNLPPTPAPAAGHRRCGTEGTLQAPAASGQRVCWNCGAEQTPPAPAAKPATEQQQQQCRPSGTEKTLQSLAAKPAAATGQQLGCGPSVTKKKTPWSAAAKPAASTGQPGCGPSGTKKTPEPPAAAGRKKKQCRHCGAEETPQWRQGPEGPRTLCNACGVRYRDGLLLPAYRPLRSPTFSPELHTNVRRRIVEMCRRQ